MRTRVIPKSGQAIPVIGMGTWSTFDVGPSAPERAPLQEVLRRFFAGGGRVIDSSPMYGRAEGVAGDLARDGQHDAFFATKVWVRGKREGERQMERSLRLFHRERLELMQVHNLLDAQVHLPVMRAWREQGRFTYLGVTDYQLAAFPELERLMKTEALDFVQLPYSLEMRAAEDRLLGVARDTGTAVLVMRPFEEGALLSRLARGPLPAWAKERGFTGWAHLLLAFILARPEVTCVLPATANPAHLDENLRAGDGPELDAEGVKLLLSARTGA
ncbi:MAG: aldo/keto reductase [Myxococcaceae bacterium]